MKASTIRIVGKHITENNSELEKGYVEIELEIKDLLGEIDGEDIGDYARYNLDMKHEDDFESNIEDFDDDELVKALEDNGYNFAQKVTEEDCIEVLEIGGYVITDECDEVNSLDYTDSCRLEEIQQKFLNGSWSERQELYNKLIEL